MRTLILLVSLIATFHGGYSQEYVCENEQLTLTCGGGGVISIESAVFGRLSSTICADKNMNDQNCQSASSTDIVTNICNGRTDCTINATSSQFGGDPCRGTSKYLQTTYNCVLPGQLTSSTSQPTTTTTTSTAAPTTTTTTSAPTTKYPPNAVTTTTCHAKILNIKCSLKQRIQILDVYYGRNSAICPAPLSNQGTEYCDGSSTALKKVNLLCQNHHLCAVVVNDGILGNDCDELDVWGYLTVTYVCQ
ncbi:L-rhamnose-binding lectin CSL3-like [Aethina tumida]|uniref:L-rhamnose-binding lectin CSL3-like n=1 Tax=Aethina tumida TaxID=116153 RepID=UPI002149797F|nr:L-rhamnose-binding lectin CSL3-like [Aethina tumida]